MSAPIEVLHVDDDAALLDIAATFLERADERLHVTTETDPTRVPDLVDHGSFDCVVSDYNMPEMTGLELLERLAEDHPDLPFVLFTGTDDTDVAVDALAAGATNFCRKQVGTSHYRVLAARIADTVEYRRERERLEAERDRLRETLQTFSAELSAALSAGDSDSDAGRLAAVRATDAHLRELAEGMDLSEGHDCDGSPSDPDTVNPFSDD